MFLVAFLVASIVDSLAAALGTVAGVELVFVSQVSSRMCWKEVHIDVCAKEQILTYQSSDGYQ